MNLSLHLVKIAGVNPGRPVAVPGSLAAIIAASAKDSARNIDEQREAAMKVGGDDAAAVAKPEVSWGEQFRRVGAAGKNLGNQWRLFQQATGMKPHQPAPGPTPNLRMMEDESWANRDPGVK